jgi:hypothetical protein
MLAVDGTKVQASASRNENPDYEQFAREIVEEAIATDAAQDGLYGDRRGDELPPEFSTSAGRRGWLRESQEAPGGRAVGGSAAGTAGPPEARQAGQVPLGRGASRPRR